MKNLLVLGLLVLGLSSCGQSLDTTSSVDNKGEDVTTETNYNRLEDIQDCLNGDREACKRAKSEGFTNAPLFLEDLAEANGVKIDDWFYELHHADEDVVIFRLHRTFNNFQGSYHLENRVDIKFYSDYSVDIVPTWKYTFQANWEWKSLLATQVPSTSQTFLDTFTILPDSALEWKSHDSNSVHVETIGNVDVK